MRWGYRLSLLVLVAVLIFGPRSASITRADDLQIQSNDVQNQFPNQITFKLAASSPTEIVAVTLRYRTKDGDALSRAEASFEKGKSVKAEYVLNTKKTYMPPGTEITYYWELEDAAGTKTKTPSQTFFYEDVRFKWQKASRDGMTLYYYKGGQTFANDLVDTATQAVKSLSQQIGIAYDEPIKIWVYDTKDDMADAMPKRSDAYEARTTTLGVRLSAEVLLLLGSHSEVKATMSHELSHMVVHQATDNPYGDIPSWLDEGLAMYAEGDLSPMHVNALKSAVKDNRLLSVRQLTSYSGDPAQVNLFYAESYSVVKFIIDQYGKDKLVELLKVFQEGSAYDKALQKVYQFDQDGLDAKWRESLGAAPRTGGANGSVTTTEPKPTMKPLGAQTATGSNTTGLLVAGGACVALLVAGGLIGGLLFLFVRRK